MRKPIAPWLAKGGPYIGPKGGLYADPAHKIPYNREKHGAVKPKNCPRCKGVAHVISRQTSLGGKDQVSSAPCRTCNPKGKIPLDPKKVKAAGLPMPDKQKKVAPPEREQPAKPSQMDFNFKKPEQLALVRARVVSMASLVKAKPPGGGWSAIPGGKRGGYRKMVGGKWEYWYPSSAKPKSPAQLDLFGGKTQSQEAPKAEQKADTSKREATLVSWPEGKAHGTYLSRHESGDYRKSLFSLAMKNDGHWRSEKQARFMQRALGGAKNELAEAWAAQIGAQTSGTVISFATGDLLKQFGIRDESRRRYSGHLYVMDAGGVVAIGKPKFDTRGSVRLDKPIETLFKREKQPTVQVDLEAEQQMRARAHQPLIDKIEKVLPEAPRYGEVSDEEFDEYDRKWGILESFRDQLKEGRDLSIKQQAILSKYLGDDTGFDHKSAAKTAHAGYSKIMADGMAQIAVAMEHSGDPDWKQGAKWVREAGEKIANGTYSSKYVEDTYSLGDGSHLGDSLARHLHADLVEAARAWTAEDPHDMNDQAKKAGKAKKLTKRASRAIASMQKISELSPEKIRRVVDKHVKAMAGHDSTPDPFAQFDKSYSVEAYPIGGYEEIQGLRIAIENAKGSKRRWYDPSTKIGGETVMVHSYGFIVGHKGADDEEVDVYLGPDKGSDQVFIINQRRMKDKRKFDEHKVMLGFSSEKAAREAYLKHYNDHGPQLLGSCRTMSMEKFKQWLDSGNKERPMRKALVFVVPR